MFDLPEAKRVRRSELHSSSPSPPPTPDPYTIDFFRSGITLEYDASALTKPGGRATATSAPGTHGSRDEAAADELEFRLFGNSKGTTVPQKVRLRSPSLDGDPGLVNPRRDQRHHFTGPTSAERLDEFASAAVSGADVLARSKCAWPGCALPWRVVTITATKRERRSLRETRLGADGKATRKGRPGKKRRTGIRKKWAANREKLEEEEELSIGKEQAEREKRTRRNREKKVKKKAREKLKKAAAGSVESVLETCSA